MRFQGKKVLVTGGNSGIGLEAARKFLAEGARVVITGRDQAKLDQVVKDLGTGVTAYRLDNNDIGAIKVVMTAIGKNIGNLDAIFVNAGIAGNTTLGDTSYEQFNNIIQTNLVSNFFLIQEALPLLNQDASIVLNGSVIPKLGLAGYAAYSASKAGVIGLMTSLSAELSPRGIRINTVIPGATKTPIWKAGDEKAINDLDKYMSRSIPLAKMGEVEDIANAVLFLASKDAKYIQAQSITVDGGATSAPLSAPIYRA